MHLLFHYIVTPGAKGASVGEFNGIWSEVGPYGNGILLGNSAEGKNSLGHIGDVFEAAAFLACGKSGIVMLEQNQAVPEVGRAGSWEG